jgi:acyl-CoA hydrolase
MIPVSQSHGVDMLSRLPNFVSINAALEVDVFGQVNAEFAGSRQIAGVGGMADFVRGAQSAPNGRAIIALAAEGKNGKSRIVPRLSAGAVTLSRADAPILVTPYGIADLRGCDVEARARAIIAIASPQHRPTLQDAWAEIRGRMT